MLVLAATGPIGGAAVLAEGGAIALVGVLSSRGPCRGFNLATWRDPASGGWTVIDRYPGDYDVFKSQILPKVGK